MMHVSSLPIKRCLAKLLYYRSYDDTHTCFYQSHHPPCFVRFRSTERTAGQDKDSPDQPAAVPAAFHSASTLHWLSDHVSTEHSHGGVGVCWVLGRLL